jgi:hypothetical protein
MENYTFTAKQTTGTVLEIETTLIGIIEYETAPEGAICKICTDNEELGVRAEYAWISHKYPGYERTEQQLERITLNRTSIWCDILTIEKSNPRQKETAAIKVFFDISDFFRTKPRKLRPIPEKLCAKYNAELLRRANAGELNTHPMPALADWIAEPLYPRKKGD